MVTSGAIAAGLPALGLESARPRDAVSLQEVSAVGKSRLMRVYDAALARDGLVGGQVLLAPLDFTVLRPGDESPFLISVPVQRPVARYRVGFRDEEGRIIGHVDRRAGGTIARSSG